MKCLSLWQPWATLLAGGKKQVETRGWMTSHRGPLLIHAAKKWDAEMAFTAAGSDFRESLDVLGVKLTAMEAEAKRGWNLPFGAIIGRVEVVGCYVTECVSFREDPHSRLPPKFTPDATDPFGGELLITQREWHFGNYELCRAAIVCERAEMFPKPIPYRGMQGMFDVPSSILPSGVS